MTTPDNQNRAEFSRPGAVDLSGLKERAATQAGTTAPAGGGYVVDITDVAEFQKHLQDSLQHVVVVEFHSARAEGGARMSSDLTDLANAAGGKWLLVRIDADQNPQLAQQIGIQAIPTVVAVIGGQLMPLFQGVQPRETLTQVIDQVLQAAVANGVVGHAKPVAATGNDADAPADPRFAAADQALATGDYAGAVAAFDTLLAETPNDAEALAGRAQAALLARTLGGQDAGSDGPLAAELAAADQEMVAGDAAAAFSRLIGLIRTTSGDDRETVRVRLLELFETRGNADPAVLKARRDLTSALF